MELFDKYGNSVNVLISLFGSTGIKYPKFDKNGNEIKAGN